MSNTAETEARTVLELLREDEREALEAIQYHFGVQDGPGDDIFVNTARHPLAHTGLASPHYNHSTSYALARHDLELVNRWADIAADRRRIVKWFLSTQPPF
jgi:hypothetical protein